MCLIFRIFVCEAKSEKEPICMAQRYEEIRTYTSNRPDKINCEWKMPFVAYRTGWYEAWRRVFNHLWPYKGSEISMSLLWETDFKRPQLPATQDPVYGMARPSYDADPSGTSFCMHQSKVRAEDFRRVSNDDASLRTSHIRGWESHTPWGAGTDCTQGFRDPGYAKYPNQRVFLYPVIAING